MGESKRRKVDGKYVSFKGDNYKMSQWRLIERFKKYMEKMEGKKNEC